jgi:putative endonuclease
MFYLYILYAASIDSYYVGETVNLEDRLYRHNHSGSKSTKKASDWQIVYTEEFATRAESMRREREIKAKKSRKYLEYLIGKG